MENLRANFNMMENKIGSKVLDILLETFKHAEMCGINTMADEIGKVPNPLSLNDARILIRRYLLAVLIEQFGTWKETGDCFPTGIEMGRRSEQFASVILEEVA